MITLKENAGLPVRLLWTLAIIAGVSVANLYYNQPLLNMIKQDFDVSDFQTNLIAMFSQVGYALGLLFIIPLGDLYYRKRIILINFSLLIVSLFSIAASPSIHIVLAASLATGVCSVIPQIFIPIAAQFSTTELKGRNVGIVVSGLLTGILASRVISGWIGEWWGWRTMYYIAAIMMGISLLVILRILPDIAPTFKGKYTELMRSIFSLLKEFPQLRVYASRSGLAFGAFMALWACLAFRIAQPPFEAGSDVVGMLGLCGIAGVLSASFVGKYVKRVGVRRFNFLGCALILAAWLLLFFGQDYYAAIIAGIIIIDIGMQCIQLSNQTSMFEVSPQAANRINTIFMTTYFAGGSLGTLLAGSAWALSQWPGAVCVGIVMALGSLAITMSSRY